MRRGERVQKGLCCDQGVGLSLLAGVLEKLSKAEGVRDEAFWARR